MPRLGILRIKLGGVLCIVLPISDCNPMLICPTQGPLRGAGMILETAWCLHLDPPKWSMWGLKLKLLDAKVIFMPFLPCPYPSGCLSTRHESVLVWGLPNFHQGTKCLPLVGYQPIDHVLQESMPSESTSKDEANHAPVSMSKCQVVVLKMGWWITSRFQNPSSTTWA